MECRTLIRSIGSVALILGVAVASPTYAASTGMNTAAAPFASTGMNKVAAPTASTGMNTVVAPSASTGMNKVAAPSASTGMNRVATDAKCSSTVGLFDPTCE